jgi:hypothetical protein
MVKNPVFMRGSGHRGRTFINVLSTLGKELFDATNNRIYLSEARRLPMNSLRMRGERLFYCFKTDNLCIWPSLPHRAVSSKKIKSDKTALETGNDMLYSIDAVTSFF